MEKLRSYLLKRYRLLGVAALAGASSAGFGSRAPTHDEGGVQKALSAASGLSVAAFVWEPSRGMFADFAWGRPVLFEGTPSGDEDSPRDQHLRPPHDIYRALARLSPDGQLLDIHSLRNLTRTSRSDESGLCSTERVAVFLSENPDAPPSLSLLDLDGESLPPVESGGPTLTWGDSLQIALGHLLDTGTTSGLGRTDIIGTSPEDALRVSIEGKTVEVHARMGETASTHSFELGNLPPKTEEGPQIIARHREPIPWPHFLANAGRSLLGNGWIAWAEGRFFSLQDALTRAGHSVGGSHDADTQKPASPVRPQPLSAQNSSKTWPPAPISSDGGKKGDGVWLPVETDLLPREPSPLFYRTLIHHDEERPYAELHLVAMDMRRLELRIGAGYEDPEPDSGPPGSGQIPDDERVFSRVVATFNGAFKTTHGRYGMKAEGRVLVAPRDGAATVTVDNEGRAGFGTWSDAISPENLRAFRQNLDPLVADGRINPSGRTVWGDHLYGSNVAVERSAICLHETGQVLYAWATEATGKSLATGLEAAGCRYAIHLDMNPGHCSFSFNSIESIDPLEARGEVLDPRMKVNATRFVRWSPKDFFYVVKREGGTAKEKGNFAFTPAPGQGPPPKSVPAVLLGKQVIGGIPIEVDKVDPDRFSWVVHPAPADGREENESLDVGLRADQRAQVLLTWGLGHATWGNPTGLTFGRQVLRPLRRTDSSLVIENGKMRLLPPGEALAEKTGRVVLQLPTVARDGKLLDETRELGGKRARSALCFDSDDNLYVGRITHDTIAPLVHELLALGCDLVAEMDRGSHSPLLLERAGTETAPHLGHEQTVLYGLGREMAPKTYEF